MTERPTAPAAGAHAGLGGNLFASLPDAIGAEVFEILLRREGMRIERIVSRGQATPDGEWYDSLEDEWVVLLSGAAGLRLEHEPQTRNLRPGDWIWLPAGCRHRVEWTAPDQPSVWLAVHAQASQTPG